MSSFYYTDNLWTLEPNFTKNMNTSSERAVKINIISQKLFTEDVKFLVKFEFGYAHERKYIGIV